MIAMTAADLLRDIALISILLAILLDKRKSLLRKTLPQIHREITPATPLVRFFEVVAVLALVSYVGLLIFGK